MTNEIEKAFEEFDNGKLWRPEDRFLDGFPQSYFEAGYKAGAEAKVIQLSRDYDQILKDKDKERFESILAERARVIDEVLDLLTKEPIHGESGIRLIELASIGSKIEEMKGRVPRIQKLKEAE